MNTIVHPQVSDYFRDFIRMVEAYKKIRTSDFEIVSKRRKLFELSHNMFAPARVMVNQVHPDLKQAYAVLYVVTRAERLLEQASAPDLDEKLRISALDLFYEICKEIANDEMARKTFNIDSKKRSSNEDAC